MGRTLQEQEGQEAQCVLTTPLLEGLDGVQKMSKSLGNYVGIAEPAGEQFGKLMSLPDELMPRYFMLTTGWHPDRVDEVTGALAAGSLAPVDAKRLLARTVVDLYHGDGAGEAAEAEFDRVFRPTTCPTDLPDVVDPRRRVPRRPDPPGPVLALAFPNGCRRTRRAGARSSRAGCASTVRSSTDPDLALAPAEVDGRTLQLGKRNWARLRSQRQLRPWPSLAHSWLSAGTNGSRPVSPSSTTTTGNRPGSCGSSEAADSLSPRREVPVDEPLPARRGRLGDPRVHQVTTRVDTRSPGCGALVELTRRDPLGASQVPAANVDLVLIAAPADRLNANRVEREVAVAWNSGARPIVLVTKSDLADVLDRRAARTVGGDRRRRHEHGHRAGTGTVPTRAPPGADRGPPRSVRGRQVVIANRPAGGRAPGGGRGAGRRPARASHDERPPLLVVPRAVA